MLNRALRLGLVGLVAFSMASAAVAACLDVSSKSCCPGECPSAPSDEPASACCRQAPAERQAAAGRLDVQPALIPAVSQSVETSVIFILNLVPPPLDLGLERWRFSGLSPPRS